MIQKTEKRQLKIAMFTNNYLPFVGGVPISVCRLAKGLRENGHIVYIFAPDYVRGEENPDFTDDPYTIRIGLLGRYKDGSFRFGIVNAFSPKIRREFDRHEFDIVHVHHPFWMGRKGLNLAIERNIPVVLTHHTMLGDYSHYIPFMRSLFKNIISHKMIKSFAAKCSLIFAPTPTAKNYLTSIGVCEPIEILTTGVEFLKDTHGYSESIREKYARDGEYLLCSVLRLTLEKNIYFIIDSVKYIKEHTSVPFKCLIIGDGPERKAIEDTIEALELKDTIVLIGEIEPEEVCAYCTASDIFVFASKSETQGMALLEAMACGCPAVAVSSVGIDDVVINGYNGYKTSEDVPLWSEKTISLMSDRKKLEQMSHNAIKYAENFSLDAMTKRAETAYFNMLKRIEANKRNECRKGGASKDCKDLGG